MPNAKPEHDINRRRLHNGRSYLVLIDFLLTSDSELPFVAPIRRIEIDTPSNDNLKSMAESTTRVSIIL